MRRALEESALYREITYVLYQQLLGKTQYHPESANWPQAGATIMGLFSFFRKEAALTEFDSLNTQISANKAKGFDDTMAGAALILQAWDLPMMGDTPGRAMHPSRNLGDLVIGFLMFSRRIGVAKATKGMLLSDSFYDRHNCLYFTTNPLTEFARKCMNRIWNKQRVDESEASEAAFAAHYATLISPFAVGAWLMLAELKTLGGCPEIDDRNYVKVGIENASRFLSTANNADPEFLNLLTQGISHLKEMDHTGVVMV